MKNTIQCNSEQKNVVFKKLFLKKVLSKIEMLCYDSKRPVRGNYF